MLAQMQGRGCDFGASARCIAHGREMRSVRCVAFTRPCTCEMSRGPTYLIETSARLHVPAGSTPGAKSTGHEIPCPRRLPQCIYLLPRGFHRSTSHPCTAERLHSALLVVLLAVRFYLLHNPPFTDAPDASSLVPLVRAVNPVPPVGGSLEVVQRSGCTGLDLARTGSAEVVIDSGGRTDRAEHRDLQFG